MLLTGKAGGWKAQWVIPPYIADFCHPAARVVIELDGSGHRFQLEYDSRRDERLARDGYRTVRFSNERVIRGAAQVAIECQEVVLERLRSGGVVAVRRNTSKAQPACGMDLPPSHACQSERSDGTS